MASAVPTVATVASKLGCQSGLELVSPSEGVTTHRHVRQRASIVGGSCCKGWLWQTSSPLSMGVRRGEMTCSGGHGHDHDHGSSNGFVCSDLTWARDRMHEVVGSSSLAGENVVRHANGAQTRHHRRHHGNCEQRGTVVCLAGRDDGGEPSTNAASTAYRSLVCQSCEGNGAVVCTQCKGGGVNLQDHFQGRFKMGAVCWLCRGKKETLCGNCNGAGFLGGFLSTADE
ncbi:hypothetical protein CBR_g12743 [Chara braunii]|uniref:BSD2 cysteine rich domain-containing protein n=1 Tax=Chara braunii TaxID=69332 RepID=A0A388KSI8_CHABU|nr:hypothetical protein CBR_g12743 [Chara braunii]|eukprot:GBG73024.1 hypothetical protein CBR_g12743 [Chara braunii]